MDAADRPSLAHPGRPGPNTRLALIGAVGMVIFSLLVLAGDRVYDAVTEAEGIAGLDRPVLNWMIAHRTPALDAAITAFTDLGRTLPMVVMALLLSGLLYWRYREISIWVLMSIAAVGSVTFTWVGKAAVGRARPPITDAVPPYETSFSFPSGHTLNSTVIAGMLAYLTFWLAKRVWVRVLAIIAAVVWAIAMGLSRIYLGHHWLTDVVFAWLLGMAWLALLITAHQLLLRFPFARPSR
ncbi:MAG TPA: phosphatase PAP2 family protein [Propionicimonas sp.]|nr:phosphatase PAP2 family protein [Propionicimonas sp.]